MFKKNSMGFFIGLDYYFYYLSQLYYGPVVTYYMVYYYTKRATLARLLANRGLAIYVVL